MATLKTYGDNVLLYIGGQLKEGCCCTCNCCVDCEIPVWFQRDLQVKISDVKHNPTSVDALGCIEGTWCLPFVNCQSFELEDETFQLRGVWENTFWLGTSRESTFTITATVPDINNPNSEIEFATCATVSVTINDNCEDCTSSVPLKDLEITLVNSGNDDNTVDNRLVCSGDNPDPPAIAPFGGCDCDPTCWSENIWAGTVTIENAVVLEQQNLNPESSGAAGTASCFNVTFDVDGVSNTPCNFLDENSEWFCYIPYDDPDYEECPPFWIIPKANYGDCALATLNAAIPANAPRWEWHPRSVINGNCNFSASEILGTLTSPSGHDFDVYADVRWTPTRDESCEHHARVGLGTLSCFAVEVSEQCDTDMCGEFLHTDFNDPPNHVASGTILYGDEFIAGIGRDPIEIAFSEDCLCNSADCGSENPDPEACICGCVNITTNLFPLAATVNDAPIGGRITVEHVLLGETYRIPYTRGQYPILNPTHEVWNPEMSPPNLRFCADEWLCKKSDLQTVVDAFLEDYTATVVCDSHEAAPSTDAPRTHDVFAWTRDPRGVSEQLSENTCEYWFWWIQAVECSVNGDCGSAIPLFVYCDEHINFEDQGVGSFRYQGYCYELGSRNDRVWKLPEYEGIEDSYFEADGTPKFELVLLTDLTGGDCGDCCCNYYKAEPCTPEECGPPESQGSILIACDVIWERNLEMGRLRDTNAEELFLYRSAVDQPYYCYTVDPDTATTYTFEEVEAGTPADAVVYNPYADDSVPADGVNNWLPNNEDLEGISEGVSSQDCTDCCCYYIEGSLCDEDCLESGDPTRAFIRCSDIDQGTSGIYSITDEEDQPKLCFYFEWAAADSPDVFTWDGIESLVTGETPEAIIVTQIDTAETCANTTLCPRCDVCRVEWRITYDCNAVPPAWGSIYVESVSCVDTATQSTDWVFESQTATTCTYKAIEIVGGCNILDDCPLATNLEDGTGGQPVPTERAFFDAGLGGGIGTTPAEADLSSCDCASGDPPCDTPCDITTEFVDAPKCCFGEASLAEGTMVASGSRTITLGSPATELNAWIDATFPVTQSSITIEDCKVVYNGVSWDGAIDTDIPSMVNVGAPADTPHTLSAGMRIGLREKSGASNDGWVGSYSEHDPVPGSPTAGDIIWNYGVDFEVTETEGNCCGTDGTETVTAEAIAVKYEYVDDGIEIGWYVAETQTIDIASYTGTVISITNNGCCNSCGTCEAGTVDCSPGDGTGHCTDDTVYKLNPNCADGGSLAIVYTCDSQLSIYLYEVITGSWSNTDYDGVCLTVTPISSADAIANEYVEINPADPWNETAFATCDACEDAIVCNITSEGTEYNAAGLGPGDFENYPHNSSDFPVLKQRDSYPDWPSGNGTVCYELWVYKDVTHNGSTYDVSGATSEQRIRTPGRKLNRVKAGDRDAYDAPHDTTWNHTTDTGSGTDVAASLYFDGVAGGFIGGHEQESASVDYTLTSTNLSDIYTVVDTDYGVNGPTAGMKHNLILYVRRHGIAGGPYTDTAGEIFLQAAHVVCDSIPVPSTCSGTLAGSYTLKAGSVIESRFYDTDSTCTTQNYWVKWEVTSDTTLTGSPCGWGGTANVLFSDTYDPTPWATTKSFTLKLESFFFTNDVWTLQADEIDLTTLLIKQTGDTPIGTYDDSYDNMSTDCQWEGSPDPGTVRYFITIGSATITA